MIVGQSFIVEPDIFLLSPHNRAFVEGKTARPGLGMRWLGLGISLAVDVGLLAVGLGVLPIQLPEGLREMRWILVLAGGLGMIGSAVMFRMFSQLRQGTLVEGRVIHTAAGTTARGIPDQHITVQFRTVEGETKETTVYLTGGARVSMPKVGVQAAVLCSPSEYQVM